MLRRWYKNLKWLFNHPCTAIANTKPGEEKPCDYCGGETSVWQFSGVITMNICYYCLKKIADKVLKEEPWKTI